MTGKDPSDLPPLSWHKRDPEQRLGFTGGRFTKVNHFLSGILALFLSVAFYGLLILYEAFPFQDTFLHRGPTQYVVVFLTFWALLVLWFKWRKLRFQRRALDYIVVPTSPSFVLSPATVDQVIRAIYKSVDDPKCFLLFNRIMTALSNLKNLGRVSDVDDILRNQAEQDEAVVEGSYTLVEGFVWAIPVLGFIGTVLGLAEAIGRFAGVLEHSSDPAVLATELRGVTAGLATAFETTLVALVAALVIQLLLTALRRAEHEFLEQCTEYCSRHIVGRLRLLPYEEELAERSQSL